jgi:SanA protein
VLRKLIRYLLYAIGVGAVLVAVINVWMILAARPKTVRAAKDLPEGEIGIVLGTAPKLAGSKNLFFEHRMDAAAELYRTRHVRHLLVTGDNGHRGYDEPTAMRAALIARGVPASAITLDFAGFRTLDSMARARTVFGIKKAILITDDFHQPRSLFLAEAFGVDALGYPSQPVPFHSSKKTLLREMASRVWACLDIYVLHTKPKFYGAQVKLPS